VRFSGLELHHLAFPPRTDAEQRRLGEEYRKLKTNGARNAFVKEYATRYTQLSRLPYFDLVQQTAIDPMHNLFLGLVKNHFYGIWVQGKILRDNFELKEFHAILDDVRFSPLSVFIANEHELFFSLCYQGYAAGFLKK